MKFKRTKAVLAVLLSGVLMATAVPVPAFAADSDALQTQVDEALATLQSYTSELEIANNDLYQLREDLTAVEDEIDQVKDEVADLEDQLSEKQTELAGRLADNYKQGGTNDALSFILGATNFEELAVRVFYADRVASYDAELLNSVKQMKAELEEKQTKLEEDQKKQQQLVDDQEQKTSEIQSKVAEQQAYYNGLDSELQAQLEREAEARREAARKAAEEAAANLDNQGNGGSGGGSNNGSNNSNNSGNDTSNDDGGSDNGTDNGGGGNPGGGSQGGGNTNSGNAPSSVVDIALAQVGKSYVLGAGGPNSFDCSGLTSYAYAQAGYYIPHSSQAQYNLVANLGHLVYSQSALSPGDLVFWASGGRIYHVAMYIGGGQVVHAANPYYGVLVTGLFEWESSNFAGGGSPV